MAEYAKKLTKRLTNKGPKEGFCAICRRFSPLTKDHVPPKNCGNIEDSVISGITCFEPDNSRIYTHSQGGSHFRTICSQCNNTLLGTEYDPALGSIFSEINEFLKRIVSSGLLIPKTHYFNYQPNKFLRSIAGHLLAANAINDTSAIDRPPPLDTALREYVLNPNKGLPPELRIYYWFYPCKRRIFIKHAAMGFFGGNREAIYGHVMKFYPFGFWFVWNETGSIGQNFHLRKLDNLPSEILATSKLALDLSPIIPLNFPEAPRDEYMNMWLMSDELSSQAENRR